MGSWKHHYNRLSVIVKSIDLSAPYKICLLLLVRPEAIACGADLSFTADVYFFLSEREISEMRGPTGLKFCMTVSTRPNFIMPVQNFGGAPPKKISGAKNMQNLARFRTTSKFGGEYLKTDEYIQNRIFILSAAIPPALGETSLVKISPVTLEISM